MKLYEAKTAFYEATETLSENTRKLIFAGIAIVWIFRIGEANAGGVPFTNDSRAALLAFVSGLILDVLQYLYKGTAWWLYYRSQHSRHPNDDSAVHPPAWLNAPTFVIFYLKVAAGAIGYSWLFAEVYASLS